MRGHRSGNVFRAAGVATGVGIVLFIAAHALAKATTIAASAGTADSAMIGTRVSIAPQVKITDSLHGNVGVAGVRVTFTVDSGGGSSTGDTVVTNVLGFAHPSQWTLGPSAGRNVLYAHGPGLKGDSVKFVAIATGVLTQFVKATTCDTSSAIPHTCVVSVAAKGDLLFAALRVLPNTRTVDSVKDSHGVKWIRIGAVTGVAGRLFGYFATNPAPGVDTVRAFVGGSGGTGNSGYLVAEYGPVDTLNPTDIENDTLANGVNVAAVTAVTTVDSDLIVPFGWLETAARSQLPKAATLTFSATRDSLLDASTELALWDAPQSLAASTVVRDSVLGGTGVLDYGWLALRHPGAPVPPLILEDWSTYANNAAMIADPRGIYVSATDEPTGGGPDANGWQFLLDQTVGVSALGLTQSMRYDQVDLTSLGGSGTTGRCTDHTVDRGLKVPNLTEVWVEMYVAFSTNFSVVAPSAWACTSGSEWKFVFGGVNITSRFDLEMQQNRWIFGYPTNETSLAINSPTPASVIDGTFHQYRFHMKLGAGSGENTLWIDGVKVGDDVNINTGANTAIDEIYLGVNLNQGPGQTQHVWWGRVAIFNQNPGW